MGPSDRSLNVSDSRLILSLKRTWCDSLSIYDKRHGELEMVGRDRRSFDVIVFIADGGGFRGCAHTLNPNSFFSKDEDFVHSMDDVCEWMRRTESPNSLSSTPTSFTSPEARRAIISGDVKEERRRP